MPYHKFSIFNFKFSTLKKGFTLIEIVVVMGLLAFVTGSALILLTNILRGNNQGNVNAEVKQNGQAVLDTLDSQIRNAEDVVPFSPMGATGGGFKLLKGDNPFLHVFCVNESGQTNGWIGTSLLPPPNVDSTTTLTNIDPVSGVSIKNCSFKPIAKTSSDPALLSISFDVSQGVSAPSRQDFNATSHFQTTISLRNYK